MALHPGDWVYVKTGKWDRGRVALVTSIDERTDGGTKACPCCHLGVSVNLGDPNVSLGHAPSDLLVLDRPPSDTTPWAYSLQKLTEEGAVLDLFPATKDA